MADSMISVIFLIILSFLSIFEVRTYMQYVFEKSLAETATTQVMEKHAVFSEILYVISLETYKKIQIYLLALSNHVFQLYNLYDSSCKNNAIELSTKSRFLESYTL